MTTDLINVGKYKFKIEDNTLKTQEGVIYSRSFRIGGKYGDCVNVSIAYNKENKPISAKISTLLYNEECSLTTPLERGEGTIVMIKTLLRHINKKIPEINEFVFEDKSNIECGTEEELYQKRSRKKGTYARPLVLCYFSIAFNCMTWYEKHFNAYQQNTSMHTAYRAYVKKLLKEETSKPSFDDFLRIAQPPMKYVDELKTLYEASLTYGDFFNSMNKDDRCRLTREWIPTFMEYYLKDVFKQTDWIIDVRTMDENTIRCRNGNETRKTGGKYTPKKNRTSYYCPKGRIRLYLEENDMGA